MRSRTCSKNRSGNIDVGRSMVKEEPQLSGAFIRNLVRQLSSSRTKEPMNPTVSDGKVEEKSCKNPENLCDVEKETQDRSRPQPKKQIRRRLHTSRPYQEKMLNMAEARREIVAALKIHRATMRKASEKQRQLPALQQVAASCTPPPPMETSCLGTKHGTNTSAIATCVPFDNTGFLSSPRPSDFSWSCNSTSPVSIPADFNLMLPKRPLGLNLNFEGFENLETSHSCGTASNLSVSFSSLSTTGTSSSSSHSCSSCTTMLVTEAPLIRPTVISEVTSDPGVESLHPVMDDKEMEEIRSIGAQQNMEWNDKVNSAHSAWWCKFLDTVETDPHRDDMRIYCGETNGSAHIDEGMIIPPWLSDQKQLVDCSIDVGCLGDASLPCLDIGELEGMDREWTL